MENACEQRFGAGVRDCIAEDSGVEDVSQPSDSPAALPSVLIDGGLQLGEGHDAVGEPFLEDLSDELRAHDGREVQERPGGLRRRDPVLARQLPSSQVGCAVDDHTVEPGAVVARDGQLEEEGAVAVQPPHSDGRPVRYRRAVAERERRGDELPVPRVRVRSVTKHAAMHANPLGPSHAKVRLPRTQARRPGLGGGHVTALATQDSAKRAVHRRSASTHPRQAWMTRRRKNEGPAARISPPSQTPSSMQFKAPRRLDCRGQ